MWNVTKLSLCVVPDVVRKFRIPTLKGINERVAVTLMALSVFAPFTVVHNSAVRHDDSERLLYLGPVINNPPDNFDQPCGAAKNTSKYRCSGLYSLKPMWWSRLGQTIDLFETFECTPHSPAVSGLPGFLHRTPFLVVAPHCLAFAMDHILQASGFSLNLIKKRDDFGLTQRGLLV